MDLKLTLFFLFLIGICSAFIAKKQGRNPYIWFVIGGCFGIIGLLILLSLPFFSQLKSKKESEIVTLPTLPNYSETCKNAEWYYLDSQHLNVGPLRFSDLLNKWNDKTISADTYVWRDSMPTWERIKNLPDLEDLLNQ